MVARVRMLMAGAIPALAGIALVVAVDACSEVQDQTLSPDEAAEVNEGGGGKTSASGGADTKFSKPAVLRRLGEGVILPLYRDFLGAAQGLHTALDEYVHALGEGSDMDARQAEAQTAWRKAMASWQRAEMLQLGPAGASLNVIGAKDIRDEIYSWPAVHPCRIDQELLEEKFETKGFFEAELVNVYGLDAIEYLLFNGSEKTVCPPQALPSGWDALGAAERRLRRAKYARAAAGDVVRNARSLVDEWEPDGGAYARKLAQAGDAAPYESVGQALDEVIRALFYLELNTKDRKLAEPLGLRNCSAKTCPDKLESPWSSHAKENIIANIEGFRLAYYGGAPNGSGIGFDDFLRDLKADALATRMESGIEAALAAFAALPGTLGQTLAADPDKVRSAYDALRKVTDALKGEFVTTLMLTLPAESAGDTD